MRQSRHKPRPYFLPLLRWRSLRNQVAQIPAAIDGPGEPPRGFLRVENGQGAGNEGVPRLTKMGDVAVQVVTSHGPVPHDWCRGGCDGFTAFLDEVCVRHVLILPCQICESSLWHRMPVYTACVSVTSAARAGAVQS